MCALLPCLSDLTVTSTVLSVTFIIWHNKSFHMNILLQEHQLTCSEGLHWHYLARVKLRSSPAVTDFQIKASPLIQQSKLF